MDGLTESENQFFESGGENVSEEFIEETQETQETQETPKEEPKESMVPYGALHEERAIRKELQQKVSSMEDQIKSFETLRSEIEQMRASNAPDPDEDPLGSLYHENETLRNDVNEMKQYQSEQMAYQQQQEEVTQVINRYQSDANEFIQKNPDFTNAYNHLR